MEGEMGFEHMQLFSVSRTYGKTFPETFCVRARLKYLPRIIGGGGGRRQFQECLGKNLSHAGLWAMLQWLYACHSASLDVCHPRAAQSTVEKTENFSGSTPHCVLHVCFSFLTSGSWLDIKQGIIRVKERILDQVLQDDTLLLLFTEVLTSLLEKRRRYYCTAPYLLTSWSIDIAQIHLLACMAGLIARPMFLLKSVHFQRQNPSPDWHMEVCWASQHSCKCWAWQEGCSSACLVGMAGGMPHWTGTAQGLPTVGGCWTIISPTENLWWGVFVLFFF